MLQNRMMKGALSLVYKKSLQFPLMRSPDISAGNIMNYMSVDVENMSKIFFLLPQIMQIPFLLVIGIFIIYTSVGIAFIGGGLTLVFSACMISWLTKIMFR